MKFSCRKCLRNFELEGELSSKTKESFLTLNLCNHCIFQKISNKKEKIEKKKSTLFTYEKVLGKGFLESKCDEKELERISLEEISQEKKLEKIKKEISKKGIALHQLHNIDEEFWIINGETQRNAHTINFEINNLKKDLVACSQRIQKLKNLNLMNSFFHIWYNNDNFGTINNFQLGIKEIEIEITNGKLVGDKQEKENQQEKLKRKQEMKKELARKRNTVNLSMLWKKKLPKSEPEILNELNRLSKLEIENSRFSKEKKNWDGINRGLGECAMVLWIIAKHHNYQFKEYQIIPRGQYSYIKKLQSSIRYELFFKLPRLFKDPNERINYPEFRLRKFNKGLEAFLTCLNEFKDFQLNEGEKDGKRKNQYQLPFEITNNSIGKISITFENNKEKWSRALTMILVNLKYLIYNSIHTFEKDRIKKKLN